MDNPLNPYINPVPELAYYDTIAGLIKCRIIARTKSHVTIQITATKSRVYRQGEIITDIPSHWIIQRENVRVKNGQFYVYTPYPRIES